MKGQWRTKKMDTIDLRTADLPATSCAAVDSDCPSGAAAAFAVLAAFSCCLGVVAGAIIL